MRQRSAWGPEIQACEQHKPEGRKRQPRHSLTTPHVTGCFLNASLHRNEHERRRCHVGAHAEWERTATARRGAPSDL